MTDAARAAGELGCAHATTFGGFRSPRLMSRCRPGALRSRARGGAGVHVLVEKPLSRTLADADALLELARAKALVLQVGHLQRFNPAFRALAAAPGKPLFIDIERLAPFKDRGTDVDVVLDLMIHDLDLVLALARAPVEQLSACGFGVLTDTLDIANARIEFADGCVANVSASRVSQLAVRKLRIFRDDGYSSADRAAPAPRARERRRHPNPTRGSSASTSWLHRRKISCARCAKAAHRWSAASRAAQRRSHRGSAA